MEMREVDVAIIGAGSAGLYALSEVKHHGLSWVLIQGGPEGTTCARVGCMPSKLLLNVAEHVHQLGHFSTWGLEGADQVRVNPAQVMRYLRGMRDQFVSGLTGRTTDRMDAEHFIRGYARFVAPGCLQVDDHCQIRAKKFIIAAGSRPQIPKAWEAFSDNILTTDDFFEQETLPRSMAIIGLGAIGLEMGQALSHLGIEVQGFDLSTQIGGISDPTLNAQAIEHFNTLFPLHLGEAVTLQAHESGIQISAGEHQFVAEKVLFAAGRRPNLDSLNLEAAGVSLDARGRPPINPHTQQIEGHPIFLAGDITGDRAVMHEASDEGLISGFNAAQETPTAFRRKTPLGIVFTSPNIARVGQACAELSEDSTLKVNVPVAMNGRARVKHQTAGSISLYINREDQRLVGAELFCTDAEHLAHQLCWAIEQQLGINDLIKLPAYHPVVEEALLSAIEKASAELNPELSNAERKLKIALD